ncbi:hypothetical protein CIW48_26960 [Methylobacterium sp. P1-11]|uniref:hypothetical protein n=1 Tax=Methylobacterium sp. P1-11 TaxID=2024616 RepID=UPI0011EF101A|nr:hypothetical protein [Methylobacterium sp. P1-11]KAA0117847.1 hypothetical protein CIW48_26960 [Methylobacterium sp. P1-11]
MASMRFPDGYWAEEGLNEYREPCFILHNVRFGVLSDHDCEAEAVFAAQDHADELADEDSAEAADIAETAYNKSLDSIHAMIAGLIVQPLPGDDEARGEQRAVRAALLAIDAIGKAPAAQQIARAA